MLILVVFHKQLPSRLERIPLRIIRRFLLCSQFSAPVLETASGVSALLFLGSAFPKMHGRKIPLCEVHRLLSWSYLGSKSHSRRRGKRRRSCGTAVISEARFNHTTSIWSHKSVLQQSCHTTTAGVWQSKLIWCCGILPEAQGTNGGQFNLLKCILWEQR